MNSGVNGDLQIYLHSTLDDRPVYVASDGSYNRHDGSAGYGVACSWKDENGEGPQAESFSGPLTSVERSAYAAEVMALWHVLAANANAKRDLYIAIDNRAVVDQLKEILQGNGNMCPKSAFGRWRRIRQKVAGQHVETMWIPSHNKRAHWTPPEEWPLDAREWRRMNDLADRAAGEGAERCKLDEVDAQRHRRQTTRKTSHDAPWRDR